MVILKSLTSVLHTSLSLQSYVSNINLNANLALTSTTNPEPYLSPSFLDFRIQINPTVITQANGTTISTLSASALQIQIMVSNVIRGFYWVHAIALPFLMGECKLSCCDGFCLQHANYVNFPTTLQSFSECFFGKKKDHIYAI
jgi:hypothetical protein